MTRVVKRAIVSVTDKSGLDSFVKELSRRGIEIIASGGTARAIAGAGVPVRELSDITGFPEIMDGRVKTLHPKVHGGILADRDNKDHIEVAEKLGIGLIDLVVVNLYRFRRAAENPDLTEREVVEEIDIGGPALIRAAAKNYHSVTVVVDPSDYPAVIKALDDNGGSIPLDFRRELAGKAFFHTAAYDCAISQWFSGLLFREEPPAYLALAYRKIQPLRYGENPHLRAALYIRDGAREGFESLRQIQGKELSYNNIQDTYAAFMLARDLGKSSCVIVKHTNPCGAAVSGSAADSFRRARLTDETSAFGGVVAVNAVVEKDLAEACSDIFLEVIAARGFEDSALEILSKRKNLRLVAIDSAAWDKQFKGYRIRELDGALLLQEFDEGFPELETCKVVTKKSPTREEEVAMRLAWKVAKHVASNAIVLCNNNGTVGIGAGQMSRVDSCRLAVEKAQRAGLAIEGSAAASDAFFPFPDGIEVLAAAGVKAIMQPGGSIKDSEVIASADALGIAMIFTGRRHFRH